jgi:hypothetical protein
VIKDKGRCRHACAPRARCGCTTRPTTPAQSTTPTCPATPPPLDRSINAGGTGDAACGIAAANLAEAYREPAAGQRPGGAAKTRPKRVARADQQAKAREQWRRPRSGTRP